MVQVLPRGHRVMSAAKKSQGALVEEAVVQYGDTSSLDLIDIGINLADPSFDEVCIQSYSHPDHDVSCMLFWHTSMSCGTAL